jgi:arginyl-tRNA synthetase
LLRRARQELPQLDVTPQGLARADLSLLVDEGELALAKQMAAWPKIVESAAEAHEPHRIAFYLYDLASAFHAQYQKGDGNPRLRFVLPDDPATSAARLAMVQAIGLVIASGLSVLGIEPVEEMH